MNKKQISIKDFQIKFVILKGEKKVDCRIALQ